MKIKLQDKKKRSAILVMLGFAIIGVALLVYSKAATPSGTTTITLTPTSGTHAQGSNFTVSLYENSGTKNIVVVSVEVNYDPAKLSLVSTSSAGSLFTSCVSGTQPVSPGKIKLECGNLGSTSATGNQKIADLTFNVVAGSGSASLAIGSASDILEKDTNINTWNGVPNSYSYNLYTADTTAPTLSITAPSSGATVQGNAVTLSANATDTTGINKVEFYANNVLVNTDTSSPYSYVWNSTTVADNTNFPITVKAYDNGLPTQNVATSTVNVKVQNSKPNLVVSAVSLSPANPSPGDIVTVTATIKNTGSTALTAGTSVSSTLSVDSSVVGSPVVDTSALAINGTRTATFSWTATLGAHNIIVSTDTANTVSETNESDNVSATTSVTVRKAGDANNDSKVDILDFGILVSNYNKTSGVSFALGDFDSSGKVDILDFGILASNWGR